MELKLTEIQIFDNLKGGVIRPVPAGDKVFDNS